MSQQYVPWRPCGPHSHGSGHLHCGHPVFSPTCLLLRARSAPRHDCCPFPGSYSPPALASLANLPPDSRPGRQRRERHGGQPRPSSHLCRDRWGCRHPQGDAALPSSASHMADTHTRRACQAGSFLLICFAAVFERGRFQVVAEQESPSLAQAGCMAAALVGRVTPPTSTAGATIPSLPGTQGRDLGSRKLQEPEGNQSRLQSQ